MYTHSARETLTSGCSVAKHFSSRTRRFFVSPRSYAFRRNKYPLRFVRVFVLYAELARRPHAYINFWGIFEPISTINRILIKPRFARTHTKNSPFSRSISASVSENLRCSHLRTCNIRARRTTVFFSLGSDDKPISRGSTEYYLDPSYPKTSRLIQYKFRTINYIYIY